MKKHYSARSFMSGFRLWIPFVFALFFVTVFSVRAQAAQAPVLAMTYTPPYGEKDPFQGVAFCEDGSAFRPEDYCATLYLEAGGRYYIKPSAATPTVELDANGCFSIPYTISSNDKNCTSFWIILLRAENAGMLKTTLYSASELEGILQQAVDYVSIERTVDGGITIEPFRSAPQTEVPFSSVIPVSEKAIAVDVGFYTDGSQPGSPVSLEAIQRQLTAVARFSNTVRFYASSGELAKAYPMARAMGLSVIGTAWLSKDKAANQAELDALIDHCRKGYVQMACVGSETLLREDLSAQELVECIQYVKNAVRDLGIPVTTADGFGLLIDYPSVRNACDIIFPNIFPYWSGVSIEEAEKSFEKSVALLRAACLNKRIIISETGWPSGGEAYGNAVAGEEQAAKYFAAIRKWSLDTGTQVCWFDAADEPWKAADEGAAGAHWGIMTTQMQIKGKYLAALGGLVKPEERSVGSEGLALIKRFEGCRLTAYKALPSEQYYTIGWGHYGADVFEGMTITQEEADALLIGDLKKYERYLNSFLNIYNVAVNQAQYDALVSFTYNLGNIWASSTYPTFQLKTFLINGPQNYTEEQIRDAFTGWNRSGGRVIDGLTRRRNAEADLFLSDRTSPNLDEGRVRDFVSRLYRNFLSREPEESGLASWTAALCEGRTTGAKVVYGFVYSKEFQNNPLDNVAFVSAMYETIFGREPDEDGLAAWVKVLENGCTRKKVLAGFLNSDEMKRLCTSFGVSAGSYTSNEIVDRNTKVTYFVSRMYWYCLGRKADKEGLEAWVTMLLSGKASGGDIAAGFFYSREMETRNLSNREFVAVAYAALLDREPDEPGLASWTAVLDRGRGRNEIVEGFVNSIEFSELCANYGIRP